MQDKISKLLVKISITIIIITIGIKYPSLEFKHEKSLKTVIKQHFASNAIQKFLKLGHSNGRLCNTNTVQNNYRPCNTVEYKAMEDCGLILKMTLTAD